MTYRKLINPASTPPAGTGVVRATRRGVATTDRFKSSSAVVSNGMYRAILPDGDLTCHRYEERDHGVELFTEAEERLAFVPYPNLVALVNESVEREVERSIM